MSEHLRQGWRKVAARPVHNGRYQHVFLPDDPHEAYAALLDLASGPRTARRVVAAAGEYDRARLQDLVANEGFSHHPSHGAAPSEGWMASYHAPEGSGQAVVHHISEITPDHIAAHRQAIGEHLSRPNSYQGGWHDTSTGDVYLDASRHFPEHDEEGVRNFCADHQQKAYFHLGDFTERFMHPKQDPLALKDRDAWRERYSTVGDQPHPRWHEYSHLYPNTPEQDEHFRMHPEAKVKDDTVMAGRPVGAFRSEAWVRHQMGHYTGE